MKLAFQPLPTGVTVRDTKDFLERVEKDPAFAQQMQAHYEAQLALPLNEDTAEMHEQAEAAFRAFNGHRCLCAGQQTLVRLDELIKNSPDTRDPSVARQLRALCDEARDYFLDVREPQRSQLMAEYVDLTAYVRSITE